MLTLLIEVCVVREHLVNPWLIEVCVVREHLAVLTLGLLRYVLFASTCVNPWLIEVCVVREHLC